MRRRVSFSHLHRFSVVLLGCSSIAFAQHAVTDSVGDLLPRHIALGFERNVNTFGWDMRANYELQWNSLKVQLLDHFNSSLIRVDRTFIKDENNFLLRASNDFNDAFGLTSKLASIVYSDQRSIGLHSLSNHSFVAGMRWNPIEEIAINPMGGYKIEDQLGIHDRGFIFDGTVHMSPLTFGSYALTGGVNFIGEWISPRYLEEKLAFMQMDARFASTASNHFSFEYRSLRRDFYLPFDSLLKQQYDVDHPIETRDENTISVGNVLQYQLTQDVRTDVSINASQRFISKRQQYRNISSPVPVFDSEIREFRLAGNATMYYRTASGTNAEMRLAFNEREENHSIEKFVGVDPIAVVRQEKIEEQKNNSIAQTQLSAQLQQRVSDADTLVLSASTIKLVYDTPSAFNVDDRDELLFLLQAGWIRRWSEHLNVQVLAEANVRHTVYISGERSANNLWNRVFRFVTATDYHRPGNFSTKNGAEVVANYSVYDFEDITQSVKSYSLRQMSVSDSTAIRCWKNFWLTGIFFLRLYERGELNWSAFKLRPVNYFDERTWMMLVTYQREKYDISAGARYFTQRRYSYRGITRTFDSELENYGPICRVETRFATGTRLFIDLWYQITKETGSEIRSVPNVTMNVFWNL